MSCWSNIGGTWSYRDLIGAKFKVKSVCLSTHGSINKSCSFRFGGEELTLRDIYFRSSTDGKIITLFRMEEVCGKLFLPRDLELIEINPVSNNPTICGEFSASKKNIIGTSSLEEINSKTGDGSKSSSESIIEQFTTKPSLDLDNIDEEETKVNDDPFLYNINSWEIIVL